MGTRTLRYLTQNRPIVVQANPSGIPVAVTFDGRRHTVDVVRDEWLIQDQWWTDEPIVRRCFDLVLSNGRQMEVHRSGEAWSYVTNTSPRIRR